MRIVTVHRWTRRLVWLAALVMAGIATWLFMRAAPQDLPWTPLEMDRPIGLFTGRKIAGLTQNPAHCRALLERAGLPFTAVPPHGASQCPVADAVRLDADDARVPLSPASVAPACPVVIGLALWQWNIVEPAAQRHFGQSVRSIRHFGSYACRRLYGREAGNWSEHATADAIDIAAFDLADGTRVSVAADWGGGGTKAAFLRDVRNGACKLFATVLSPDYNAQHHDHFHLDQAERGEMGWRVCR